MYREFLKQVRKSNLKIVFLWILRMKLTCFNLSISLNIYRFRFYFFSYFKTNANKFFIYPVFAKDLEKLGGPGLCACIV